MLINQGASIALVSKYLCHSNISITLNIYTLMYASELEEMTEILNKLRENEQEEMNKEMTNVLDSL